jgi:hypothetical protein
MSEWLAHRLAALLMERSRLDDEGSTTKADDRPDEIAAEIDDLLAPLLERDRAKVLEQARQEALAHVR